MRVNVYTQGCKVNLCESQAICQAFTARGHSAGLGNAHPDPDLFVLNTCAVTLESEKKCRKSFNALKRKYPGAASAVCGCMTQTGGGKGIAADILIGSKNKLALVDYICDNADFPVRSISDFDGTETFENIAVCGYETKTRAFLKIEDGCDRHCSYCIIPRARGRVRSLSPDAVLKGAETLVKAGHREIVLTGINLAAYGSDIGFSLLDALKAAGQSGVERLRLSSLETDLISDEFLDFAASMPSFCPHFHLSLQSGSDSVLSRMNRRYSKNDYLLLVEKIRKRFDSPAITTDIMVGFPGESDAEFQESLDFVEKTGFSQLHVFTYSPRPGTKAAAMPQLDPAIKKERSRQMLEAGARLTTCYLESMAGKTADVLFEAEKNGLSCGLTRNYITVYLPAAKTGRASPGEIKNVVIGELYKDGCTGRYITEEKV